MTEKEALDFSSLPPLPKDHLKLNGVPQKLEKFESTNETVQDGGKVGKVQIQKEVEPVDESSKSIKLEQIKPIEFINNYDTKEGNCDKLQETNNSTHLEEIQCNKVENKIAEINTKSNVENITLAYIDENLSEDTENLSLNNGSHLTVGDGATIGSVPGLTTHGSSIFRAKMNLAVRPEAANYKMNHRKRGLCVIFNFSDFDRSTQLNKRNGTNEDREALKNLFSQLSFEVHCFDNLKSAELFSKLNEYANGVDHSESDCLVIFFMSHGEENLLYASDYAFDSQKLFMNFTADNCTSLAGKPKLFFIQACRGTGVDDGVTVFHNGRDQTDYSSNCFYKIPTHADFLICYSTIGGYFSWRNTVNGSWFVQSLVKVFREKAYEDDVLSLMTAVNRRMIMDFESNCPSSREMHAKKQTACITSTLTRKIFLKPPQ